MRNLARPIVVLAIAAVLGVGGSSSLFAQDRPVLRITLDEAQDRALRASHLLAERRAREAAAQAVVSGQQASQRPIVAAVAGYTRTNHVTPFVVLGAPGGLQVLYPDIPDNYRTRLDLQWPIYTAGRPDALERSARAEAAAVSADTDATRSDLRLEVARAFWAIVTAQAAVAVLERGVARAQAHVAEVRQRFNVGLVPPNEVASAEAQDARERMLLIEARNQREVTSATLARLIDVDPLQLIEPQATLVRKPIVLPQTATLIADGRSLRGERRAIMLRIQAAEDERAAAAAGRRPSIFVGAGTDYARPNPRIFPRAARWEDSWDAGLTVTWPLWDGGRVAADVSQATSVVEATRERLAEFDSVLALEVRQRVLEIDSGQAAVVAADEGVRAAAEARRVVGERYSAGVITQTEVLDAEFALLQAELDQTRALADVRLAEARLERAIGR